MPQLRKLIVLAALPLAAMLALPVHAQDSQDPQQPQSLGDLARQLRKDKEKNNAQPKIVVTDDTLHSANKAMAGFGGLSSSQGAPDGSAIARAEASLSQAEAGLDKLDSMDRATLAKAALLDKDVDFPNRRSWEEKLYAAKGQYVSRGKELFQQMRQCLTELQSLQNAQTGQGKINPNDPRAKELLRKIEEIIQEGVRADREYQTVVVEGWDRAKQAQR